MFFILIYTKRLNILQLLHLQSDKDLFNTCLSLLHSIAVATNTTEMPAELKSNLRFIQEKAIEDDGDAKFLFNELIKWYRIKHTGKESDAS